MSFCSERCPSDIKVCVDDGCCPFDPMFLTIQEYYDEIASSDFDDLPF